MLSVVQYLRGNAHKRELIHGVEHLVTDDAPAYTVDLAQWHQLCQVRFLRHVRSLLTDERGLMTIPEMETVLRELGGVLDHLRASVEKHRVDGNKVAITDRTEATLRWLGEIGTELERRGLRQT